MMIVAENKARFRAVVKALEKKPWFKKEKWRVSLHCFPSEKSPDGVTFQLFKDHWWNDERQGIHIESYLDIEEKKRKKSFVTIHLLHSTLIPGTKFKRIALSKPFVDEIYKEVKGWPGYKFRAGKYGTQPFTRLLDGTAEDFEQQLEEEVSRMCVKLGPVLEKCLGELVGNKSKKTSKA